MNASILSSVRRSFRTGPSDGDPVDVLGGIEPDAGGDDLEQDIVGGARSVVATTPTVLPFRSTTLRIDSCANSSKQAGCTPASMTRGNAGVDPWDRGGGEVLDEVRVSAREPIGPDVRICAGYVADVGEPLVAQEIVEDVNRRKASRAVLPIQEPHRGRLRRRLFRHRSADARERRGAGKARGRDRKTGREKMSSVLHVRVPSAL